STDEGLDQSFNTLDAQREAAEAFVNSQRHEGWTALSQKYDDGGFTGANMDHRAMRTAWWFTRSTVSRARCSTSPGSWRGSISAARLSYRSRSSSTRQVHWDG